VKRTGKMVVIDDIVTLLWPEHDRDHVTPEEFRTLLAFRLPMPALLCHLPHADGDLGRAQVGDAYGSENWISDGHERALLLQNAQLMVNGSFLGATKGRR
jgi:hypothetical protein